MLGRRASFPGFFEALFRGAKHSLRLIRTAMPGGPEMASVSLTIGNEKMFDLGHPCRRQLVDMGQFRRIHTGDRHGQEAVVADRPAFFRLLGARTAPMSLALSRQPAKLASSAITRTSRGSPSSARVPGMEPKS